MAAAGRLARCCRPQALSQPSCGAAASFPTRVLTLVRLQRDGSLQHGVRKARVHLGARDACPQLVCVRARFHEPQVVAHLIRHVGAVRDDAEQGCTGRGGSAQEEGAVPQRHAWDHEESACSRSTRENKLLAGEGQPRSRWAHLQGPRRFPGRLPLSRQAAGAPPRPSRRSASRLHGWRAAGRLPRHSVPPSTACAEQT